jgi:hypothetical protein
MDELVAKVAAATGLDSATARKAVVIILQFLANAGPKDQVAKLIDALPGARAAVSNGGAGPSDMMGAFGALTAAGLGMAEVQSVATAFGRVAREEVGVETFDQVVASIPGLSQFV